MNELPVGASVQLTPDQIAQAQPSEPALAVGQSVKLSPEQRQQTGQMDPIQDFSAEQLAELQNQNPEFNLVNEYSGRTDLQQVPGMNQKIADAHNILRRSAFKLDVKKVPGQLWDIAKGFGKQAWNYAQAVATPIGAAVTAPFTDEETTSQMFKQGQREVAENVAGTELGLKGLGETVKSAAGFVGRKVGLEKSLDQYTPEEKVADLFDAMKSVKSQKEIATGKGPILSTLGSEVVNELQKNGTPVRPEEVASLSAGDPFSWYLMGKAFHGIGAAVPEGVSNVAGRAAEGAGNLAARLGGKTVETAADITKLGADAVSKVAPSAAGIVGAVKGAALHGPAGLVTGLGLGYKAGKYIAEGAKNVSEKLGKASEVGEQISGAKPIVSPVAQLGRDVLTSAPGAAVELGKGVSFDLGLAAVTSEESPEERAGLGIGTAFGALGAGARMGGRVLSGQIIAPRAYGVDRVVPSSGQFPALDAIHNETMAKAEPGIAARLNAVRLFTKGIDPNSDVFLAKDSSSLATALQQTGMTPEQAKTFSDQNGFFSADLPDKNGKSRRVIVVKDPDTAPHEAFHAIQDVLGEEANQKIDQLVKTAYADQWDAQGNQYAARLIGSKALQNKTWREAILDASGWGRAEAADKIARDVANKLQSQSGAEPDPAAVRDLANGEWSRILSEAAKKNPNVSLGELQTQIWRDVLSPTEAQAVGDKYLARELAAENFDAVFKHTGPGLEESPRLLPKLSNIVANLVSTLGGEPLAGRVSDEGAIPLKQDVSRAVVEAARGVKGKPVIEPVSAPKGGIPATPEEQKTAANEARELAKTAPAEAPAPREPNLPTPQSPREVLGTVAEAIAKRGGVKINYLSAPEEPAAATTSNRPTRRAMIEAFRSMPTAARRLWEKTFFPERVLKLKGERYQVLGWAPEVFAANAHKLAHTLSEIEVKNPGSFRSPYELDLNNRTFTEKGWRDLFEDAQTFARNQMAGRTGAGEKLVVPPIVTEKGFTAPPVTGGESPLMQEKADFVNMLFNFRLPDTARVTSGKLPLNIAGQEVSSATKPGRVRIPVEPKPKFTGEAAQKLGIEGRSILETNPARNALEQAARSAGVPMPSMIEAIQRLALEHISEVQHAPEATPEFRGNTLILTAGFQPGEDTRSFEKKAPGLIGTYKDGFNDVRSVKDLSTNTHESLGLPEQDGENGVYNWRYRPDTKTVYWWGDPNNEARESIVDWLSRMGYAVENTRRIVVSANPTPSYRAAHGQFSPVQAMDSLKTMPDDDFLKLKEYQGKLGGGVSGWAFDLGASAKTEEDLQAFKHAHELFQSMGREAMRNKDMDGAVRLFTKSQLAREAYEVATGQKIDGSGEAGNTTIKLKKPDFMPPFLGEKSLASTPEIGENEGMTGQFKTKVKEADWKLKPASSGFSKAWILPDGRPVQLGGQWHHDWLNENADIRKQFKVPSTETTENNRAEALKRGFTRINYDARDGKLTVEAREQNWPDVSSSVKKFIETNLPQIDKVQMYLFDKGVNKVADSGFANLFDKPKDQRLAAVPFIGAPGEITEMSPQATKGALSEQAAPGAMPVRAKGQFKAKDFDTELESIRSGKAGGQTFDSSGKVWSPGKSKVDLVSLASLNVPKSDLTREKFQDAVKPYESIIGKPNIVTGVYSFEQDGKPVVSIDINAVVPQEHRKNTLDFAKANDQRAIWDASKNEEVPSGGAGNTRLSDTEHLQKAIDFLMKGQKVPVDEILSGNTAQFSPKKKQEEKTGPVWFSQLQKTIADKMPESATISQLEAIVKNPQNGVKADELKWSGLDDFFKQQSDMPGRKVTKVGIQKFLKANQLQLREIQFGGTESKYRVVPEIDSESGEELGTYAIEDGDGPVSTGFHSERAAEREILAIEGLPQPVGGYANLNTGTKFQKYQLPGGKNYQELLFQLPMKQIDVGPAPEKLTSLPKEYTYIHDSNAGPDREWGIIHENQSHARPITGNWWPSKERALEDMLGYLNSQQEAGYLEKKERANEISTFKGGHWDERNVIAHARVNEREDSEGRPGLFMEELQSDWHQRGRKEGYQSEVPDKEVLASAFRKLKAEAEEKGYTFDNKGTMSSTTWIANPEGETIAALDSNDPTTHGTDDPYLQPLVDAHSAWHKAYRQDRNAVPDAPFKTNWHEMVFRRMVRQAAEQGKEWLGWTTGEQQNERYDLSKQVKQINYTPKTQLLTAVDLNSSSVIRETVPPEKLADYIGKDAAEKILNSPTKLDPEDGIHVLRGDDLKVGGSGMKGFYDKILMDYARKFGKKFGAKVEDRGIPNPERSDADQYQLIQPDEVNFQWIDWNGNPYGRKFSSEQEAKKWFDPIRPTIHSIEITPEMRESVLKHGVAQFQAKDVSPRFSQPAAAPIQAATNKKSEDLISPRSLRR